ncbi:hypothetical protein [Amycolatopsis speibonae]|uniref:Uncharacterized protein n=1 Tax=Amycolatopsis speibonae TaxID=1450224 RepID=A0ABV7PDG9_9PSEU
MTKDPQSSTATSSSPKPPTTSPSVRRLPDLTRTAGGTGDAGVG